MPNSGLLDYWVDGLPLPVIWDSDSINLGLLDYWAGGLPLPALYGLTSTGQTITVADSGRGTDSLSTPIVAPFSVSETGRGTDAPAIAARFTQTDSGRATAEAITVHASFALADSGRAISDGPASGSAPISIPDTGRGTDATPTIARRCVVSDTGRGVDASPAIAAAAQLADTGHGTDVPSKASDINGFFNVYTYSLRQTLNEAVADKSAVAFHPDEGLLYSILNSHYMRRFSRDLALVGAQTSQFLPAGTGTWDDTEGICWYNGPRQTGGTVRKWAALNEGDQADYSVELVLFNLAKTDAQVSDVDGPIALSSIPRDADGGAEGLDYDAVDDQFYVGSQSCKNVAGIGLWRTSTNANSYATQTLLWKWYDVLVTPGIVANDTWVVGDIALGRVVGKPGSIFVLVSNSTNAAKVVELSLSTGALLSSLTLADANKCEGLCFDSQEPHDLYICADNSGNSLWRYSRTDTQALRVRSVQTGEATNLTLATTDVTLPFAILPARSILTFTLREDATGTASVAGIGGYILNGTTIRFVRSGTTAISALRWQVVEFASGLQVEHKQTTGITTANSGQVSLTNYVTAGRGLILTSIGVRGGNAWNYDDFLYAKFDAAVNGEYQSYTWSRAGNFGSNTHDVYCQVIEFTSAAAAAVQDGDVTADGTSESFALSPSIAKDKLLIFHERRCASGDISVYVDDYLRAIPNADPATAVSMDRTTARGTSTVHVWAVALADGVVQHYDAVSSDGASVPGDVTVDLTSPVSTDRAILLVAASGGAYPNGKVDQADAYDGRHFFCVTAEFATAVNGRWTQVIIKRGCNLTSASSATYHIMVWEPASGSTQISISETGRGTEALSGAASLAVAETGRGTDAPAPRAALSVAETGKGTDAPAPSAALALSDAGHGTDAPTPAAALALADTGRGTEPAIHPAAALAVAETGSGTDAFALGVRVPIAETGTGTEALAESALCPVDEYGRGIEVQYRPLCDLAVEDSGTGLEEPAVEAFFSLEDSGLGTDAVSVLASLLKIVADSALGSDSSAPSVGVLISIPDSGNGAEGLGISVSLSVAEAGRGADAISLLLALLKSVADAGTGTDALALAARASVADLGRGSDSPAMTVSLSIPEFFHGYDGVELLKELTKTVEDAGRGTDSAALAQIRIPVADNGRITETPSASVFLRVNEAGRGADVAQVVIANLIQIADWGIGFDSRAVRVSLGVGDLGRGTEALALQLTVSISESGRGSDAPRISAAFQLADAATAAEVITAIKTALVSIPDTGSGIEVAPAISAHAPVADLVRAIEEPGIAVALSVSDAGSGIDQDLVLIFKLVSDAAIGSDALQPISVSVPIAEAARAADVIAQISAALALADFGDGVDVATRYVATPARRVVVTFTKRKPTVSFVMKVPEAEIDTV